jgi:hypothetical protein
MAINTEKERCVKEEERAILAKCQNKPTSNAYNSLGNIEAHP